MSGIDYRQLRRQITMREVLRLIDFQPTWQHGPQLRGACPIPGCSDSLRRSFSVHLTRQVYHCFACRSHGNALDLWAAVRCLSLHQAGLALCHILHFDVPWLLATRLTQPTRRSRCVPSRAPSRNR